MAFNTAKSVVVAAVDVVVGLIAVVDVVVGLMTMGGASDALSDGEMEKALEMGAVR
jgi:hypothetical protein